MNFIHFPVFRISRTNCCFRITLCLILLLPVGFLTGCSNQKKEELEEYHAQMETFFSGLVSLSESIDTIDPASETASSDLTAAVDQMVSYCSDAAEITPPEEYKNVQIITCEARDLMITADTGFHTAFDGEYDEAAYQDALTAYDEANEKIRSMISLLRGNEE